MQSKFASLMKTSVAVVAMAVLAVSCKKENDTQTPLKSPNEVAAVPGITSKTITGRWGNPALGPAVFGTVYLNFTTGVQDTVGTNPIGYDVQFTSSNNSVVKVPAGYTLKFLNSPDFTNFATLKTENFTGAAVASIGRNTSTTATANGWYNYVVPAGVTPISGAYILITKPNGTSYALQFVTAAGQGTNTNNRGVYGIQYGVINNN